MKRPLVLVSNDDGYRALGITTLAQALREHFSVVVCAPDREQSASSHSLSLNRPLRVHEHGDGLFSVDGTPADSVYIALHERSILPEPPVLVVSGMNHGLNLGQDVFYSGTVAAAREAALQGFPALAVSAHHEAHLLAACQDAARLAFRVFEHCRGEARLFNANYPPGSSWSHRATSAGRRVYSGGLVARHDPRGRPYYWIGGDSVHHEGPEDSDTIAFDQGVVGITPLILDLWSASLNSAAEALCDSNPT
jgi:5'-nucleotidase